MHEQQSVPIFYGEIIVFISYLNKTVHYYSMTCFSMLIIYKSRIYDLLFYIYHLWILSVWHKQTNANSFISTTLYCWLETLS